MSNHNKHLIWIHCNICAHKYITKDRRFFVLSCQTKHVLCGKCMSRTNLGKMCPMCKVQINYMEINEKMSPKARDYFDIQSRFRQMEHMTQVASFQRTQMQSCMRACYILDEKYEAAVLENRAKEEEFKRINTKCEKARNYRQQLEQRLKELNEMHKNTIRNNSSGYGSMDYSPQRHAGPSFLSGKLSQPVDNVFETGPATPTLNLFGTGPTPSTSGCRPKVQSNVTGRPSTSFGQNSRPKVQSSVTGRPSTSFGQNSRPNILGNFSLPFHSQKASTPTEASRNKVLTQDFSFQSTPSTVGNKTRR